MIVDGALGARTSRKAELTEVVVPLMLGLDTEPVRKTARGSRRPMLYVGGALAIFGTAALAVVLATGAELPKPVVSHRAPIVVPVAAPSSPVVVAPKAEIVGEAIAPAVAAAPAPAIQAPIEAPVIEAPAIDEAPVVEATPVKAALVKAAPVKAASIKPASIKPASIKPAPSRPVLRKAIAHPVKKAAKPKYDPDALFFKGN